MKSQIRGMQRFLGVVAGLLILFWIISAPRSAAATVDAILVALGAAANSIIVFFQTLF